MVVFDELAGQYQFRGVDANRDIGPVFRDLRAGIEQIVGDMEGAKSWHA